MLYDVDYAPQSLEYASMPGDFYDEPKLEFDYAVETMEEPKSYQTITEELLSLKPMEFDLRPQIAMPELPADFMNPLPSFESFQDSMQMPPPAQLTMPYLSE